MSATTITSRSAVTTTTLTGQPRVFSVSKSSSHTVSKNAVPEITLVEGLGVAGDCHAGKTVQHQAQQQKNPAGNNLRQVHLVPIESLREVSAKSKLAKSLSAGEIGENITTEGVELASLPRGTELHFVNGASKAVVVLTGVREPGPGINKVRPGLQQHFLIRNGNQTKGLAGVMGIVKNGGVVKPGMRIDLVRPTSTESLPVI